MKRLFNRTLALATFATSALAAPAALAIEVEVVPFDGPNGTSLEGVRYLPDDYDTATEPLPAVVMLHGCTGIWSNRTVDAENGDGTPNLQNHIEKWGLRLAAAGYVAIAVDSYTPRTPTTADTAAKKKEWQNQCSGATNAGAVDPYTTRVLDARAAYDYLVGLGTIDEARVGLLGWSQGAEAAMVEIADSARTSPQTLRDTDDLVFATAVVYYPGCGSALGFGSPSSGFWLPYTDFRMNHGDDDSLYTNCEARFDRAVELADTDPAVDPELAFDGYVDAAHSFDAVSQTWPSAKCAGTPTGDTCAMNDADIDSLAFFATYL